MAGPRTASLFGVALLASACGSLLGVDGDYALLEEGDGGAIGGRSAAGGRASGGRPVAGGAATAGGGAAAGGGGSGGREAGGDASGGASACEDLDCEAGAKCCLGICVLPSPLTGCGLESCERCAEPPQGAAPLCVDEVCDFECGPGLLREGEGCIPAGTGGAPGAGGAPSAGGAPTACDPRRCPGCPPFGILGCCQSSNDQCGCTWAPGAYCSAPP